MAHDQCAMKVSTDSLILGSFVSPAKATRILDIGTGSGILALMLAQKMVPEAHIEAIDIDQSAVIQALENVRLSPWPENITVSHCALQSLSGAGVYDLIVSNPPYFADANGQTKAYDTMADARGIARTEQTLSVARFFAETARLSNDSGKLYCMYPWLRHEEVLAVAAHHGWHCVARMQVQHRCDVAPYLVIYEFSREAGQCSDSQLIIRAEDNQYTPKYKALCQEFYLNF
ncbi:tRNA1(Val) (adenine(37)-N6)-methyltransferase [Alteromonas lipolytica]|uniref:tRNA1(Val) (adenine(37)-N6)-methyltransferase n=1 Tax=Alteromonas lipolytica TaxID=1856405 RepID=UPI00166C165F|nr:methyltransferase [Alteromonas lipolytica]GGF59269.1 tRNA1(Val) (adenine(37)-N6)-methyltransferase [Alteromonas lipolytica]